jgi:hypothetical protein
MRLRTHILTSALLGAALYSRAPRKAALLVAGGVLLDVDHYLLYALRSGNWSPLSALRYNRWRKQPITVGDRRRRYGSLRSIFHTARVTLPLVWLFGWRWPALRPLAIGVTLHLALDISPLRMDWRVWRRAGGRCERCGRTRLRRGVYYVNLTRAGGSRWALHNRAAWCYDCALAARCATAGHNDAPPQRGSGAPLEKE